MFGKEDGRKIEGFTPAARKALLSYSWPGNIRELKNTVERAVCRTRGAEIRDCDIEFDPFRSPYRPLPDRKSSDPASHPLSDYPHIHDEIDIAFLKRALEEGGGSQKKAAELLGITYDQFRGIYRRKLNLMCDLIDEKIGGFVECQTGTGPRRKTGRTQRSLSVRFR